MYYLNDEMWWELHFLEDRLGIDFNLPEDGIIPENNEIRGHGPEGEVVTYIVTPPRMKKRTGKIPRNRTWLTIGDSNKHRVSDIVHALSFDDSGQTTGEAIRYGPKDNPTNNGF